MWPNDIKLTVNGWSVICGRARKVLNLVISYSGPLWTEHRGMQQSSWPLLMHQSRGGVTRVTGAAAYFMLLLCARLNSQTLKFHSPISPDPLNARLLGFPESPPRKYPRSANDWLHISQIKHMETLLCRGQMASKSVFIKNRFQPICISTLPIWMSQMITGTICSNEFTSRSSKPGISPRTHQQCSTGMININTMHTGRIVWRHISDKWAFDVANSTYCASVNRRYHENKTAIHFKKMHV